MQKNNIILFSSLIGLTVIFLSVVAVQNHYFRQVHEQSKEAAIEKAIEQDEELSDFRVRLTETETELDSLKQVYQHDSTWWTGQNEQLRETLSTEKKNTITYKRAYESTKKALEKRPVQRIQKGGPAIIDLSPILDSTRTNP